MIIRMPLTIPRSEAQNALQDFQSKSQVGQKGRFQGVLERLLRLRQTYALLSCIDAIGKLTKPGATTGPSARSASST